MRNIKLPKNNPIKQADVEHRRKKDILLCVANIAIDCGLFPEFCEFVLDNLGLSPEEIDDRFRMHYGLSLD